MFFLFVFLSISFYCFLFRLNNTRIDKYEIKNRIFVSLFVCVCYFDIDTISDKRMELQFDGKNPGMRKVYASYSSYGPIESNRNSEFTGWHIFGGGIILKLLIHRIHSKTKTHLHTNTRTHINMIPKKKKTRHHFQSTSLLSKLNGWQLLLQFQNWFFSFLIICICHYEQRKKQILNVQYNSYATVLILIDIVFFCIL